jgi:hypothetical protein
VLVVLNLAGFPRFRVRFLLVKPLSSICLLSSFIYLTIVSLSSVVTVSLCMWDPPPPVALAPLSSLMYVRTSGTVCENLWHFTFQWHSFTLYFPVSFVRSSFSHVPLTVGPLSSTQSRPLVIYSSVDSFDSLFDSFE